MRLGLKEDTPPKELKNWQDFLTRVNNTYTEADQERYSLDRSMEISSREMHELNKKLEQAQHIAQLGYWSYIKSKDQITLSKELISLFGLEKNHIILTYKNLLDKVYEEDRPLFEDIMEHCIIHKKGVEIRIQQSTKEYRWYYFMCQPSNLSEDNELIGVAMDVTHRKEAENEITLLNHQLVSTARQAGMADVATSMLHNVGNILNSTNISVEVIDEHLKRLEYYNFFGVIDLLKEHSESLTHYLTSDEKGILIPKYIIAIAEKMKHTYQSFNDEIINLKEHIQKIRDIIKAQQSISEAPDLYEKLFLPDVVQLALQMTDSVSTDGINVKTKFEGESKIYTDKAKLLQILINLLQNAHDAVMDPLSGNYKEITIEAKEDPIQKDKIIISVHDNGIGIPKEKLDKIFTFGYTTKINSPGFGLHISAIAANDINGNLRVESPGLGLGATFYLTIPLKKE